MKYYHATTKENMMKICVDGVIKHSFGSMVFLCSEPLDACKFLLVRGCRKICVIGVEISEEKISESYDHCEAFFGCKAYMHDGDIVLTGDEDIKEYVFDI